MSPRTRTTTSTTMKIRMSSQKALRMSGKELLKELQEKNVSLTEGQPGLVKMSAARPPRMTMLETAAIRAPRRAWLRFAASRSARRLPVAAVSVTDCRF